MLKRNESRAWKVYRKRRKNKSKITWLPQFFDREDLSIPQYLFLYFSRSVSLYVMCFLIASEKIQWWVQVMAYFFPLCIYDSLALLTRKSFAVSLHISFQEISCDILARKWVNTSYKFVIRLRIFLLMLFTYLFITSMCNIKKTLLFDFCLLCYGFLFVGQCCLWLPYHNTMQRSRLLSTGFLFSSRLIILTPSDTNQFVVRNDGKW